MDRLLSRSLADLVCPSVNDRLGVDVIEIGENACLEFGLRRDADVTEHRPRHLREQALHEIEPRTVLRREYQGETAFRAGGEPRLGFLRSVGGMVVEEQFDGGIGGIGGVEPLEEADEFARAMAILDTGLHLAGQQIDPGQQA